MILHLPVATGQVLVAEGKAMSDISAKAYVSAPADPAAKPAPADPKTLQWHDGKLRPPIPPENSGSEGKALTSAPADKMMKGAQIK
jgi:hypothetical protein